MGDDVFWKYFDRVQSQFSSFEELEETYSRIEESDRWEDFFNWSSWDLEFVEWKAGRAVTSTWSDVDRWLSWLYVVQGLHLIRPSENPLEPRSSLKSRSSTIDGMLDFMKQGEAEWIEYLQIQNREEKTDQFRELHQEAVAEQREIEKAAIREKEVSAARWSTYRENFLEHWRGSDLRRIFQAYGRIIDKTDDPAPEGLESLQISIFYPKEAFIEDRNVHYSRFGESEADAFIRSERNHIIDAIGKALSENRLTGPDATVKNIDEAMEILALKGYSSPLILTNVRMLHRYLDSGDKFTPRMRAEGEAKDLQSFRGYFAEAPLLYVPIDHEEPFFYVIDLSSIGMLVQYQVEGAPDETFDFQLDVIDQERAEEIYAERPDLRHDPEGQIRPKEDVLNELQEKVILKIKERPRFEIEDGNAGTAIIMVEENG